MSRLPGVQRRDSLLRGWGTCALLASCALASCVGPLRVKVVDAPDAARVQTEQPFGSEGLSERTAQTLRVLDLERMLADNPVGAIAILDSIWRGREAQPALAAEAELLYLAAARVELQDPERSAAWYLLAAARAFEYLFGRPSSAMERAFDSNFLEMRELYNRAVAAYVVQLDQSERGLRFHVRETAFETFRVRLDVDPGRVDPAQWDSVLVAADLEVKGLRNHYSRDGIGASLVTLRENRQSEPMDRFHPPEGIVNPATAVVTFEPRAKGQGDEVREATLAFFDPRQLETLEVDRFKWVPLAADFTTPFAYLVSRSELLRVAQEGLLHPAEVQPRQGLYLMEPYDPEKIPLIMVHGLRSSPLAWMELTNDLFGDPRLRSRYQIWYYLYPTGLPFLYSGMVFRGTLELLRSALDPEGDDPAMGSMVIVAHSMGGLLTRTLVSDSGMRLWNAALRVPPEDLVATEGEIEWLREILIFSPKPYVSRVIFIATPHRGSESAEGLIGRLGSSLVELPESFSERIQRLKEDNSEVIAPEMLKILGKEGPTSIRTLWPNNPLIQTLAQIPIDERIPFHTIVGDRGRGTAEVISDGFVTYESSHLEGAESERIVPSGHAAYVHPQAIAEIKRILKRHLATLSGAGSSEAPADSAGGASLDD